MLKRGRQLDSEFFFADSGRGWWTAASMVKWIRKGVLQRIECMQGQGRGGGPWRIIRGGGAGGHDFEGSGVA